MPRNPSGVFSLPAGSTVTTGNIILASSHNDPLNDIASDLNAARPVVAGGTGADSAADARTNLGVPSAANPAFTGDMTITGTVDGRDIASDGSKLDTIEASADVTDAANVTAAGALMDSELTSEASVKALNQGVSTTDSPTFAGLTATTGDFSGDVDVVGGLTKGGIEVATIDALTTLGHRNKILNGQFNINQRGETSYTATGYTLDRWRLDEGTGAACTIKQGTFALGQTDVPGNPKHYLIWERATAGSSKSIVSQQIEGVATLAGQTVTRTFWVKATAATQLRPVVRQSCGSGGLGISAGTVTVGAEVSVTTGWQKVTVAFDVPGVSGKTLGNNGDDYLELAFERDHSDTNPTATVYIANVSIVEGDATSEADPGAWREKSIELLMCQRYYLQYNDVKAEGFIGAGGASSGSSILLKTVKFPVQMRGDPSNTVITAPSLERASGLNLISNSNEFYVRIKADGAFPGYSGVTAGVYSFNAEMK